MMHAEVAQAAGTDSATTSKPRSADASQTVDEAIVAAIALALELEGQPEASRIADAAHHVVLGAVRPRARAPRSRELRCAEHPQAP